MVPSNEEAPDTSHPCWAGSGLFLGEETVSPVNQFDKAPEVMQTDPRSTLQKLLLRCVCANLSKQTSHFGGLVMN